MEDTEANKFNLTIEESEIKTGRKLDDMSKVTIGFLFDENEIYFNVYKGYLLPDKMKGNIYNEKDLNANYSFGVEVINSTKQTKMIYKTVVDEVQTKKKDEPVDMSPNLVAPDILDEPISSVEDSIDPFDLPF